MKRINLLSSLTIPFIFNLPQNTTHIQVHPFQTQPSNLNQVHFVHKFILASMKKINLQNQEANEKFSMCNESQSDHKKLVCFICYREALFDCLA